MYIVQPVKPVKRSVFLQNARHKYYWNDPCMPAFRFLEDEDDRGNTIEEIELFRPLGMSDFDYLKKIEVVCCAFFVVFVFWWQFIFMFCSISCLLFPVSLTQLVFFFKPGCYNGLGVT